MSAARREARLGTVRALFRHPVKSLAGESLEASRVECGIGMPGDRAWALRDVAAGEIRGAKKLPALLGLAARCLEEPEGAASPPIEIDLAAAGVVRSDDALASQRISQALGRELRLCPRRPAADHEHYRRAEPIVDFEAEIREASELLPHEPVPSLSEAPADLSLLARYVSPPGTYFDCFEIHLLSQQSLTSLAARAPGSQIAPERFRPNILVDLEAAEPHAGDWPELAWCGRTLRIGEVLLDIVMPMMRCGMTTHAQRALPKDPAIMRVLVRDCGMNLGVGAEVRRAGQLRVGDELWLEGAQ